MADSYTETAPGKLSVYPPKIGRKRTKNGRKIKEGQMISCPLFNEPVRVETGRASAEIYDKVAHYHLSVDALTQPMHVCEDQAPYGKRVQ